jgi:glyceraldehyde-3-phosphate dehydrogenase/erythrose-4-phosphate dehydrogenase
VKGHVNGMRVRLPVGSGSMYRNRNNVRGRSTNESLKRMLAKAPKGTRLDR